MTGSFLKVMMIIFSNLLYLYRIQCRDMSFSSTSFVFTKLFILYKELQNHIELISKLLKLCLYMIIICAEDLSVLITVLVP